jgi:hypothetical protein
METSPLDAEYKLAQLLLERLERLSVDSRWARRSSGLRGSLLKILERWDYGDIEENTPAQLESLITRGFEILEKAAQEIRGADNTS